MFIYNYGNTKNIVKTSYSVYNVYNNNYVIFSLFLIYLVCSYFTLNFETIASFPINETLTSVSKRMIV